MKEAMSKHSTEMFGWIVVIALLLVIIVWKVSSG
jgi:hypothetical protein